MTDIQIRGIDALLLGSMRMDASAQGVSLNDHILGILRAATRVVIPMPREQTLSVLQAVSDLGDEEVMASAWR